MEGSGAALPWALPVPPRRRRTWPVALVLLVVLGLVAGGVAWSATDGASSDVAWDARIEPLAGFVEDERDLEFRRPVPVTFVTEAEFDERMRVSQEDLTDDDRASLADSQGLVRALGLGDGDLDLVEESNDYGASYYAAYYDPAEEEIVVPGDGEGPFDVMTRGTLVHELTHALQDQHYDIDRMFDEAYEPGALGVRGLIEGDAMLVEYAWIDSLSASEEDEYWSAAETLAPSGDLPDVSVVTEIMNAAPYDLGYGFVSVLRAVPGELDRAFEEPLRSDEDVFDPLAFIGDDAPRVLDTPDIDGEGTEIEDGTIGAVMWFAMLAERLDAHDAYRAVRGWDGDAFVSYRDDDDRVCVRAVYAGETRLDTERMHDALDDWIDAAPDTGSTAAVELADGLVELVACDPGPDAELRTGRSLEAMALPVFHSAVVAEMMTYDVPREMAACYADAVIGESTVEELADPEHEKWGSDDFQRDTLRIMAACE